MIFGKKPATANEAAQTGDAPKAVLERPQAPRAQSCADRLSELISAGKKKNGAVFKLYLENFKSINDTFGYQFGEQFLTEICDFLTRLDGAQVFRLTGVEYIIIFENMKHSDSMRIADEITERFEGSWNINNLDCMCAMNLAVTYYPGAAKTASEMLTSLSYAITESGRTGQNQLIVFDDALKMRIFRTGQIAREIPKAVEAGYLELRYRPVFSFKSGRFTRADCCFRLCGETFGVVNSAKLIAIAEESGQIRTVTMYAIAKTCKLIASLIAAGKDFESIAVPVSPILFLQNRFVDDVAAAIKENGIPANRLAFEINESASLTAFSSSQERINELSDMGIEVILAEFGTSSSKITGVIDLSAKLVKLDRMFIWSIEHDHRVAPLAKGLVNMAHSIGLWLIAEGVETQTQVQMLQDLGCDYAQGFYYSPTVDEAELTKAFDAPNVD